MRKAEARIKRQETRGRLREPSLRVRPFLLSCFLFLVSYFLLLTSLYALTPHSITIDGNLSEWHPDEILWEDSHNDSPWGVANEIHGLYLTWDAAALYIGVRGVQKDGNNLVVYIDTSPLSGVADVSNLKEPGNPSAMWWWRRGNRFAEGFRPDFQWHMYEMKLNTGEGHGFFRLYPDGNTASLNGSALQAASGGGAGVPGSAEVRIPWSVLYGGAGFPEGEAIRIAAMVTGGMDTRGTADPSDDLFGSARDVIPDQKADFPDVWHAPFTVDTWLTAKLESPPGHSSGDGRSPSPRNLSAVRKSPDTAVVSWTPRGVVEKKLYEYRIYYGDGVSPDSYVSASSTSTSADIGGLAFGTTYHFYLRAFYDASGDGLADFAGGKSEAAFLFMARPAMAHIPTRVFCFPGKKLPLGVSADSDISSAMAYRSSDGGATYAAFPMNVSSRTASAQLDTSANGGSLRYYFEISAVGGVHRLPYNAPSEYYETFVTQRSSAAMTVSSAAAVGDFGGGVQIALEPGALRENVLIFCEYSEYRDISLDDAGLRAAAFYDFYALGADGRRRGVVFENPAEITLRYFDEDIPSGTGENSLIAARIDASRATRLETARIDTAANLVTARAGHLSSIGVFAAEGGSPSPVGTLKKVVRPVFSPSLGEVVEFDVGDVPVTVEIFNLKGVPVRHAGRNFWDGRDSSGAKTAPGAYLWKITTETGEKIYGSCVVVR